MKYLKKLGVLLLLCASFSLTLAADVPDSYTKSAIQDLSRYEQQASALTANRASNVRRMQKLVNLSYERLQQSTQQSEEIWQQTNARYGALNAHLAALLNPGAKASGNGAPANTAAATNAGQSSDNGASQSTQTSKLDAKPSANKKPAGAVPPLVSGQRVRVKKLTKDINAVAGTISTTGPSRLQDQPDVQALQKRFGQFRDAIARYPQLDDPDVVAANQAFNTLQQSLRTEYARAQSQMSALGDVQARITQLQALLSQHPVPDALSAPFDQAKISTWLELAGNSRSASEHVQKQIAEILPNAYLPETRGLPDAGAPFERKDVERISAHAQQRFQQVQSTYGSMVESLKSSMSHYRNQIDERWQQNPETIDGRWVFLDVSQQQQSSELFAEAMSVADSYIALEAALKRDTSLGEKLMSHAKKAKITFETKQALALSTSRMPEAVSNDKNLLAIASEIVAKPKYEFGKAGQIVLTTAEIIERERKDSEVEFDDVDVSLSGDIKLSGTETTWTYRWEEFKFAVPLHDEESGKWHIWWITAKNFSSGSANTPIGRWVSGGTNQGNEILEEHI